MGAHSWILLLAATFAYVHAASDEAYIENIALRFSGSESSARSPFPRLPFASASRVFASETADAFWIIADDGLFVLENASAFHPAQDHWTFVSDATFDQVSLPTGWALNPNASDAVATNDGVTILATANSTGIYVLKCSTVARECRSLYASPGQFSTVTSLHTFLYGSGVSVVLGTNSSSGASAWELHLPTSAQPARTRASAPTLVALLTNITVVRTMYYDAGASILTVSTTDKLWMQDRRSGSQATSSLPWRFEWVSVAFLGAGGLVADVVTAVSSFANGTLWLGNSACLNARLPDGRFARVDGLSGLPMSNITAASAALYSTLRTSDGKGNVNASIVPRAGRPLEVLWLGTKTGLIAHDPFAPFRFRFLAGPRWLPDDLVLDVAFHPGDGGSRGNALVTLTATGMSVIVRSAWTLEAKAAHYQALLARHDRYGLTSDCSLPSFGNGTECMLHDSDNDGLWTSLTTVAEALRYATTKDPAAWADCNKHYQGMKFLNRVTGRPGFMARSFVRANESHGSGNWANSTAYPGWVYKRDTSSDEVTGHVFAYSALLRYFANSTALRQEITQLLQDIATYIQGNGWFLIDPVTGQPTTWGQWAPSVLNGDRRWMDGRGLNSLQIVAYLAACIHQTAASDSCAAGLQQLLSAENDYGTNLVNQKIVLPADDNFSDDELAFLPYYTLFVTSGATAGELANATLSLARAWEVVAPERPDLWSFIYLAANITGQFGLGDADRDAIVDRAMLNLRSWPLELIDWPVRNSVRQDIFFRSSVNREMQAHTMSVRVLPANERNQFRWNSNPFTLDGGSGGGETDPGAWLLPYWMGRYHGFIDAASL